MRLNLVLSASVGFAALTAYATTLFPDLPGGDSGEIIAATAGGGVIHPPGYPLYALIAGIFGRLPWGTLAWRYNLFSAICDAAAAGCLCFAAAKVTRSAWAGLLAGSLFAFSPGVWAYATAAEVFALNNLLVALLVLTAAQFHESPSLKWAIAGALLIGLGLSNHHTYVFAAVPLSAWVLYSGRATLATPRRLALLAASFATGLTPYLALPGQGRHTVEVTWGATDSWPGFWNHVLRREYGTFQLSVSGLGQTGPSDMLQAWGRDIFIQVGWWGLTLIAVGIVFSLRTRPNADARLPRILILPPLIAILVFSALGNLPMGDALHQGIVARFWQLPETFFCVFAAFGAVALAKRIPGRALPVVCCVAAGWQLGWHWKEMNRKGSLLVLEYGAEILRAAPPGALLVTKGDLITNSVRYLQFAERRRPDVRVVDQELLAFPWAAARLASLHPEISLGQPGRSEFALSTSPESNELPPQRPLPNQGFRVKDLFDANFDRFPIVVCGGIREDDRSASTAYSLWPHGVCERLHRSADVVEIDHWVAESEAALPRIDFANQPHPKGSWEDVVWNDCIAARQMRALRLMDYAGADPARRGYLELAAHGLEAIAAEGGDLPAPIYRSLAVVEGRLGLDTPERRARTADAWRKYLQVAPNSDPQLPTIRKELENLSR